MMRNGTSTSFRALKQIEAGVLHVGYAEAGKSDAPAVIECAAQDWGRYSALRAKLARAQFREGNDLQRMFQELRTSQDPFMVWMRQRAKDLLDGLDLTQASPEWLSTLVFDGPSAEEDEASYQALEEMERIGMINP